MRRNIRKTGNGNIDAFAKRNERCRHWLITKRDAGVGKVEEFRKKDLFRRPIRRDIRCDSNDASLMVTLAFTIH